MSRLALVLCLFISSAAWAKSSWQGTYYPGGCLTCEASYTYSPAFRSFKDCKAWATKKMQAAEDKATCGLNCEHNGKLNMSKCELVVRSWPVALLPDSPTFETYKAGE